MFPTKSSCSVFPGRGRQQGQALIYGIFVLLGGLAALYFLFNTGQLSSEKTKLVNTADAVVYSAGVMHARALNFDAYTNRALIANEVMIAQLVSLASWAQYAEAHEQAVPPLNCYYLYSVPIALGLLNYMPLCYALSYDGLYVEAVPLAKQAIDFAAPNAVKLTEGAKYLLQKAQVTMYGAFGAARAAVMDEVANENYVKDGKLDSKVQVDPIPIADNFYDFKGGPFIRQYSGDERTRFKEVELAAAYQDQFVKERAWSDHSLWSCIPAIPRGEVDRTGGTVLNGFDEWKAVDKASLHVEVLNLHVPWFGVPYWSCDTVFNYSLGEGEQSTTQASGSASSSAWNYSGVPKFYELSAKALDSDDPRVKFSIRLIRKKTEARTSAGKSLIKPAGRMDLYQGSEVVDVMAAVATSEVFFERPVARVDGQKEIGSLFNPYWQVHLIASSAADINEAKARQKK